VRKGGGVGFRFHAARPAARLPQTVRRPTGPGAPSLQPPCPRWVLDAPSVDRFRRPRVACCPAAPQFPSPAPPPARRAGPLGHRRPPGPSPPPGVGASGPWRPRPAPRRPLKLLLIGLPSSPATRPVPAGRALPSCAPATLRLAPPPRSSVGEVPRREPAPVVLARPRPWAAQRRLPWHPRLFLVARLPPLGGRRPRPRRRGRPPWPPARGPSAASLPPPRAFLGARPPRRPRALPAGRTPPARAPSSCPRARSPRLPCQRPLAPPPPT